MPEEMTVEEYRVRIALEASDALSKVRQFRQEVNTAKKEIQELSKQSGEGFRFVGESIKQSWGDAGKNVKAVTVAMKELGQQSGQTGGALSTLGSVGQFVFGAVLGITAVTVLRKVIDLFVQATKAAIDFSRAQFQLEVGVRALQRAGMNTTLEGWYDQIENLRQEFGLFSKQELTEGVAVSLLKLREFGFTEDQIKNTQRMAATLSLLTGKDFTESIQGVTYALGSGYFEALQRAGIQISRTIVAQEALKRGFEGAYQSLDDNIRAQLTYDIIMRQVVPLTEDATKATESLAGEVKNLDTTWTDFLTRFGALITPLLSFSTKFASAILEQLEKSMRGLQKFAAMALTEIYDVIEGFRLLGKVLAGELKMEDFWKTLQESSRKAHEQFMRDVGLLPQQILGNEKIGKPESEAPEVSDEAVMSVFGADAQKELDKLRELEEDFQQDLARIDREGARRRLEIWNDYYDKLEDINRKENQKVEDENRAYSLRKQEEETDSSDRRAEIEARYRNNEITAEARFQERLRQLREGFLMQLEDAVHERDARQVLRLTKQYNLEKAQMKREEALRKDEAWRQFQLELQFLAAERAAKLRNLELEHQERLRQIRLQADRERQEAIIDRERQKEDLDASLSAQRDERRIRYKEQQDDLVEAIKARLAAIADGLASEETITLNSATRIYNILNSYYGPGGAIEGLINYYYQLLQNAAAAAGGALWGPGAGGLPYGPPNTPVVPDNDEGGSWIATKPTMMEFGGGGPELVTFTPLNKKGVNVGKMRGGGSMPAGMGGGSAAGQMAVRIVLSPGLEAAIMENTLNEAANMIMRIEREKV